MLKSVCQPSLSGGIQERISFGMLRQSEANLGGHALECMQSIMWYVVPLSGGIQGRISLGMEVNCGAFGTGQDLEC